MGRLIHTLSHIDTPLATHTHTHTSLAPLPMLWSIAHKVQHEWTSMISAFSGLQPMLSIIYRCVWAMVLLGSSPQEFAAGVQTKSLPMHCCWRHHLFTTDALSVSYKLGISISVAILLFTVQVQFCFLTLHLWISESPTSKQGGTE